MYGPDGFWYSVYTVYIRCIFLSVRFYNGVRPVYTELHRSRSKMAEKLIFVFLLGH
jgi:hypothetical protein